MNGDNAHILVVDDDDRIRDLLKRFLTREGYRVTSAPGAEPARRLMNTMSFDLAILDVMMPGEDGLSLLRGIREGRNKDTPVMLLTARGQASDRIAGLKFGADDYLPKPFEPEELSLRCAAILRRSHKAAPPRPHRPSAPSQSPRTTTGRLEQPDHTSGARTLCS